MKILHLLMFLPVLAIFVGGCRTQEDAPLGIVSSGNHYETSEHWLSEDETFLIRSGMTREEVNRLASPIDLAGGIFFEGSLLIPVGYLTLSKDHYDVVFDDENQVVAVYKSQRQN